MNKPKVIVLLPVYHNDTPAYLQESVQSMLQQSYEPLHILIGMDGPMDKDMEQCVRSFEQHEKVTLLTFAQNRGLAATLNDMIRWAQEHGYTYFARMDADDIAIPERIERQMNYLLAHPDIDIVGGSTNEIDGNGKERHKINHYPLTPEACYRYFAKRNPLAHPTVIFRQSYFDKTGCLYRPEFRQNQDTMLWFDGLKKGARMANIPEVVLNFRVTDEFFSKRRNGWEYAKDMLKQRRVINRELHYGLKAWIYAYALFLFRLSPTWVKRLMYQIM